MIIHTPGIKEKLEKEFMSANAEIIIISAFAKIETLKWVDSYAGSNLFKVCVVRFRLEDILGGVTDFKLIEYCRDNGWVLFINEKLHSKVYCLDKKRYLVGSANLTHAGLGLTSSSNIESMVYGNLTYKEYFDIKKIVNSSLIMNDNIFNKMKIQIDNKEPMKKGPKEMWDINNDTLGKSFTQIELDVSDLLEGSTPLELTKADKEMLGLNEQKETANLEDIILDKFLFSNFFEWFHHIMEENQELYFGNLTTHLHGNLARKVPDIQRREVKIYLANLLKWIEYFNLPDYSIDRPNYSQRIRVNR